MKNNSKSQNEMKKVHAAFTYHCGIPDEIAAKSLSDVTVSSTVTHGPDAAFLKSMLESLNEACLGNQPETVAMITAVILENGLTMFMDISKMEIIIAHTRAVTILHPNIPVKDYFEDLVREYYLVHTVSN